MHHFSHRIWKCVFIHLFLELGQHGDFLLFIRTVFLIEMNKERQLKKFQCLFHRISGRNQMEKQVMFTRLDSA